MYSRWIFMSSIATCGALFGQIVLNCARIVQASNNVRQRAAVFLAELSTPLQPRKPTPPLVSAAVSTESMKTTRVPLFQQT
jgi:hypothetical protein